MNAKIRKSEERFKEIRNSKAFHNFHVGERYEAGLILLGPEVKSLRTGKGQINESFVRIDRGIPILFNAHFEPYAFGNYANPPATRPRKLLLNKKEINELRGAVESGGFTLIPTRLYFKHGLAKIEVALCKGKKLFDKRQDIKTREAKRETDRAIKRFVG